MSGGAAALSCAGKAAFGGYRPAEAARRFVARGNTRRKADRLAPYACRHCGGWHLGPVRGRPRRKYRDFRSKEKAMTTAAREAVDREEMAARVANAEQTLEGVRASLAGLCQALWEMRGFTHRAVTARMNVLEMVSASLAAQHQIRAMAAELKREAPR